MQITLTGHHGTVTFLFHSILRKMNYPINQRLTGKISYTSVSVQILDNNKLNKCRQSGRAKLPPTHSEGQLSESPHNSNCVRLIKYPRASLSKCKGNSNQEELGSQLEQFLCLFFFIDLALVPKSLSSFSADDDAGNQQAESSSGAIQDRP